jgi:hypothetical protein
MIERMLNLAEAAEQLGYEPSGLREIVHRTKYGKPGPQIQFYQIGNGHIKFRQEWLDLFVLQNSIAPGQIKPAKKQKRLTRTVAEKVVIEPHWSLAV